MATVLVVEDEEKLRESVEQYLFSEGFKVLSAGTGMEAIQIIRQEAVDLVLLDIMLPELNGIQVCQIIRQSSNIPILIVSALGAEEEVLDGLGKGADDYIIKPFRMRELVARVRAILRRSRIAKNPGNIIYYKVLTLDLERINLMKNDVAIQLTPTEFRLISMMAQQIGRAFTRLQLLEGALGEVCDNYERVIDTHIFNLRKKIESSPGKPEYIQTVFGIGYRFGDSS